MEVFLGTDGSGADFLQVSPDQHLTMDGPKVFEFTAQRIPPLVSALDDSIGRPRLLFVPSGQ